MSISVYSQSGADLLISPQGANLSYLGRATFTGAYWRIFSPYGPPLVFFNTAEQGGIKCFVQRATDVGGGYWSIFFDAVLRSNENTYVTPALYCFGPPLPVAAQGQGVQMFDPSGRCLLDSTRSPLRMREYAVLAAVSTQAGSSGSQRSTALTQAYSTPLICSTGSMWRARTIRNGPNSGTRMNSLSHSWVAGGVVFQKPTYVYLDGDIAANVTNTDLVGAPTETVLVTDLSFYE